MILELYPISQFDQNNIDSHLEYMRKIRNESSCRENMTRCIEEITSEMQKKWYESLSENITPYIFVIIEHGVIVYPCGYGLITIEDGIAMLTGVIEKDFRGKGYGRDLFSKLIKIAKTKSDKVSLEVLETNYAAKKLYESLGFVSTKQTNNTIFMELSS
jgi:ribosomal protein S18 acetylase RimI-like enzyme